METQGRPGVGPGRRPEGTLSADEDRWIAAENPGGHFPAGQLQTGGRRAFPESVPRRGSAHCPPWTAFRQPRGHDVPE